MRPLVAPDSWGVHQTTSTHSSRRPRPLHCPEQSDPTHICATLEDQTVSKLCQATMVSGHPLHYTATINVYFFPKHPLLIYRCTQRSSRLVPCTSVPYCRRPLPPGDDRHLSNLLARVGWGAHGQIMFSSATDALYLSAGSGLTPGPLGSPSNARATPRSHCPFRSLQTELCSCIGQPGESLLQPWLFGAQLPWRREVKMLAKYSPPGRGIH